MLFCFTARKRKFFWLRFIPCAVFLLFICPYVIGYFRSWMVWGGWFASSFAFQYIFSVILVGFCFEFKWQQTLFYCSSAYAIEHCFNAADLIARSLIGGHVPSWGFSLIHIGLMALVYTATYFVFVRKIVKLDSKVIKSYFALGVSLITVLITNLLSQWMAYVGNDLYHNIYDSLLCVMLLIAQYGLFCISELVKKNQDMKLVLHMSEEQHKMSQENIELINMKCHDLKHQIEAIRDLQDSNRMEESLKKIENSIMIYDSILKTGNPTLDTILTEKKLICEKHGIRFSFIVDGASLGFIDEEDIYALFGNALDNAIENVTELEDIENRVISIRLVTKGKILSVHIDNACKHEITFKDGLPVTTKQDKRYHGYGMKSIKFIVEKYGGNMSVFVKDGMFNLNITIPVKDKKD